MPPFLSLIIPAHNEEHRLPDTLERVHAFLSAQRYTHDIWVIKNGSRDRTAAVAESFARSHPGVHVRREALPGKGRAVRHGMLAAAGEYRFICDADLSMPIAELNRFLPPRLDGFDIAIASREAEGAVRIGEPAYRHWIGRAFNLLVRSIALPDLRDTQCGFKCFRGEVARDLFAVQRLDGWTFDVEVLYIAHRRGYRIVELPIPWYHIPGSRVRLLRDSWAMFTDLFRIRRNWSRGLYHAPPGDSPTT